MNLLRRLGEIKNFVFDMDGVLTDGRLIVQEENIWVRQMNIRDGYAMQLAVKCGYRIIVISGSHSSEVSQRLKKLGIDDVLMGVNNKKQVMIDLIAKYKIDIKELLYMGDDLPDYEAMQMAGIACCPADAVVDIKRISCYVSSRRGGDGCVRDVVEKVLRLNDDWPLHTDISSI